MPLGDPSSLARHCLPAPRIFDERRDCVGPGVGIARRHEYRVRLLGEEILGMAPHEITRRGIAYVPQGRRIWPSLSVDETLRLYSPAWQTMRRAIHDDNVAGYYVPASANIYLNSYLLHRHRSFWESPDAFIPERFSAEGIASRPKHVYMPFGGGPRICLGKYFALTELQLVVATISQRFTLRLPPGAAPVEAEPLITLHPKGGVHLVVERH